jgi:membrane protein YdbS with pleckstrin-like domain
MSPLRIIYYLLLLFFVVGFWYLIFTYNGFSWSYAAGIVITLIVVVLLFIRDRK